MAGMKASTNFRAERERKWIRCFFRVRPTAGRNQTQNGSETSDILLPRMANKRQDELRELLDDPNETLENEV